MENGPGLKIYFLLKMGSFQPAMLVCQRVDVASFCHTDIRRSTPESNHFPSKNRSTYSYRVQSFLHNCTTIFTTPVNLTAPRWKKGGLGDLIRLPSCGPALFSQWLLLLVSGERKGWDSFGKLITKQKKTRVFFDSTGSKKVIHPESDKDPKNLSNTLPQN